MGLVDYLADGFSTGAVECVLWKADKELGVSDLHCTV
jgi:hypothetical protein